MASTSLSDPEIYLENPPSDASESEVPSLDEFARTEVDVSAAALSNVHRSASASTNQGNEETTPYQELESGLVELRLSLEQLKDGTSNALMRIEETRARLDSCFVRIDEALPRIRACEQDGQMLFKRMKKLERRLTRVEVAQHAIRDDVGYLEVMTSMLREALLAHELQSVWAYGNKFIHLVRMPVLNTPRQLLIASLYAFLCLLCLMTMESLDHTRPIYDAFSRQRTAGVAVYYIVRNVLIDSLAILHFFVL